MKIALASEVYPPRAGGAGWSTRALALALRAAGHDVTVLTTSPGPEDLDGLRVRRLRAEGRKRLAVPRAFAARDLPAWRRRRARPALALRAGLPGRAGARARVAVTVRDHWPVCFWSTRISRGALCPECGLVPMTRCVEGRVKARAPLSWGAIPYMWADLRAKRQALAPRGRDPGGERSHRRASCGPPAIPRVEVLPNMVDAEEVRAIARSPARAAASRALPALRRQARGEQGRPPPGARREGRRGRACPWWCSARARSPTR